MVLYLVRVLFVFTCSCARQDFICQIFVLAGEAPHNVRDSQIISRPDHRDDDQIIVTI